MKKLLYLFILFGISPTIFAQDYNAIDLYLKSNTDLKNHFEEDQPESLNVLLSIYDCDNCIPMLYSYIKNTPDKKPYAVNIFTDNMAYAKKTLGDAVNFKYNLYYNKEVFSKYLNSRSGIYYIDTSNIIYGNEKDIRTKLKNAEDRQEFFNSLKDKKYILTQDSLMSGMPYIIPTPLPDNQLLVFDNKMDTALLLELEDKQDSLAVTQSKYYTPTVGNLKKMFDLPSPIINLLSFEENQKLSQNFLQNMVKLYSITYWNNQYYATFSITRAHQADNNIRTFSTYFVATQKADGKDMDKILDASSYDNYYMIDDLPYEGKMYRIIGDTRTKPQIVADNTLNWRIRLPDDKARKVTYSGLATLELKDGATSVINIDREFDEFLGLNGLFMFNGKTYYLSRATTNEENNEGFLSVKEFDSQYINKYLQKVKTL
ncbi:hypothetical protein [Myroides indicus]|uniref:Thioredoxin-like protein n=1 Tax=Myroides indicus TaxID=1323422 RepID=A0A4R7F3Z0_9FLAO|nr:hypothetical protein [Myroides indicus]TDS65242.1 hypothetical protein C8P70_10223 [Myroides indicus]